MFPSRGQGAGTSAPPPQDTFREVFQSRLQARLNSQDSSCRDTANRTSRLASPRALDHRGSPVTGRRAAPGATTAAASHPAAYSQVNKTRHQEQQVHKGSQSQAAQDSTASQKGSGATGLPQGVSDLLAFLQALPGGALTVPPEQVPAVSSYLVNAGLPQAEVNQLLTPNGSQGVTLTAANLMAAWQQAQGQGAGPGLGQPQAGASQTQTGADQSPAPQDIRQTQDYQALWDRLSLPQSQLPTLRLALAKLGATPEALAKLDEQSQGGQGIPLTRVWQMLQNVTDSPGAGGQTSASSQAVTSQSALVGQQPVTGGEMAEWRQMLLAAGLPSEVVDKLWGRTSPDTQGQLKTRLLSMAPDEQSLQVIDNPKPLYLPANLRLRPFFWQGQNGGSPFQAPFQEQAQGQAQLNGNGAEAKGQNPASQLASLVTTMASGENMTLPSFAAELQGLTQGLPDSGGAGGQTGPVFTSFSPEIQESLWSQLQTGVTANLGEGQSQVTISLNPPELGQIQLSLQLSGQEVAVTAVATRPEVAEMASQGVQQLVQALTQQGLVLTQFQIHVQDQPTGQVAPVASASRGKGGEPGGSSSTSSRRRHSEVDRFV